MASFWSYGTWTKEMNAVVAPYVMNRLVWDLGAGGLGHSYRLLQLGASHVIAVDKERMPEPELPYISTLQALYKDVVKGDIETALLAWPSNHAMPGLIPILANSDVVIYLGSNVDGSACGSPALWEHFAERKLLAVVPHPRNSLLVFGRLDYSSRELCGEELAARSSGVIMSFEDAWGLNET